MICARHLPGRAFLAVTAVTALTALASLSAGCGTARSALLQTQMRELQRELREVRAGMASSETQIEQLQGEIALLDDKLRAIRAGVASAPAGAMRGEAGKASRASSRPHALPVVTLGSGPRAPRAAARGAPSRRKSRPGSPKARGTEGPGDGVLEFQELSADGRIIGRSTVVPAGPSPARVSSPLVTRKTDPAQIDYDAAFARFRSGDLDSATAAFQAFVSRYPRHHLTDNAIYWWAECSYHRRNFVAALRLFQRILEEHPDGNKVPDAMLKMGLCLINLDDRAEGLRILEQVESLYPASPAARVAHRRRAAFAKRK